MGLLKLPAWKLPGWLRQAVDADPLKAIQTATGIIAVVGAIFGYIYTVRPLATKQRLEEQKAVLEFAVAAIERDRLRLAAS